MDAKEQDQNKNAKKQVKPWWTLLLWRLPTWCWINLVFPLLC
jgi:hypothetical protein